MKKIRFLLDFGHCNKENLIDETIAFGVCLFLDLEPEAETQSPKGTLDGFWGGCYTSPIRRLS